MQWRWATKEDAAALEALIESAYRGDTSRAGWTTEADLLDGNRTSVPQLLEVLADDDQLILACDDDDGLLATVTVERRDGYGYVGAVSVRPTDQGSGIGRELLARAERTIREEWGLQRARMTVIAQRPELIDWYGRRGYADTGETAPFPYGDTRFGAPKRDDLYFVILEKALGHDR
jgi:GNAT superfamily N-acetyltransferase